MNVLLGSKWYRYDKDGNLVVVRCFSNSRQCILYVMNNSWVVDMKSADLILLFL